MAKVRLTCRRGAFSDTSAPITVNQNFGELLVLNVINNFYMDFSVDAPKVLKKSKIISIKFSCRLKGKLVGGDGKRFVLQTDPNKFPDDGIFERLGYGDTRGTLYYALDLGPSQQYDQYYSCDLSGNLQHAIFGCINTETPASYSSPQIYTNKSSSPPYLEVEYGPVTYSVKDPSPSSGSIDRSKSSTFRWAIGNDCGLSQPIEPEVQASAKFKWRETGSSVHTVNVSGAEPSVTVPGGTFPSGEIQWSVEVRLTNGQTITSDWSTLSTQEVASTAQAISPDGGILDGTSPIEFAWKHIISTGTEPTGADIETGTNGTTFTRLAHVTGAATTYTAPKNALASGDVFWRVRTYNTDGKPGAWSPTARFVVVGAPPAPSVRVDKVTPCPKIQWQSATQQAYEIAINDRSLGVRYGTDKAYRPRRPLPDGASTIKVRVQNKYGLWSAWGSVTIQIKNTPGPAITLTAAAGIEATLRWTSSGAYPSYAVLRDGEWIAVVQQLQYTDRFTAGTHTYQIIGLLDEEGRHTVSNLDTVQVSCPHLMICAVDDPSWISLARSTSPDRQLQLQQRRDVRYVQYSGAQLPTAEMGSAKNTTYSFDAAWTHKDAATADAFAALLGRLICLKDPYGNAIIGILDGYTLSLTRYIRAYSCRLTAVNWKEVLDDPGV